MGAKGESNLFPPFAESTLRKKTRYMQKYYVTFRGLPGFRRLYTEHTKSIHIKTFFFFFRRK